MSARIFRPTLVAAAAALLILGTGCGLYEDLPAAAGETPAEGSPPDPDPTPRTDTTPVVIATASDTGGEAAQPADRRPDPRGGSDGSGCEEASLPHRPALVRHMQRPAHPAMVPACRDPSPAPRPSPTPGILQRAEAPQPTAGH
jgi:hypothetical protein